MTVCLGVLIVALFVLMRQRTDALPRSLSVGALAAMRIAEGRIAPAVTFDDAQGQAISLERWRGRVVVVNLWGQWCSPCREELPSLAALARSFEDSDLAVVAVAADTEKNRQINRQVLADLTGGQLEFHFDPGWKLARALGAGGFPTTVVFGRSGQEIARLAGSADWASVEARRFIDHAIGHSRM